jgi:hypothetical protein
MFRKLLLSTVACAGLLTPLTIAPAAQANDHHNHHRFKVMYRDPCNGRWVMAGRFFSYREAERVAESYRCRGFVVSVR